MALLFRFAVFVIPINGIYSLLPMGELSSESAVYVFLPLLVFGALSVSKSPFKIPWHLQIILCGLLMAIALSFFVNLEQISSSSLKGRSGFGRTATTVAVPIMMILLSSLASQMARTVEDIEHLFIKPLAYSIFMCGIFAIPDLGKHFFPGLDTLDAAVDYIFRPNSVSDPDLYRVHSICFEPPSLSYITAISFPWILCGYRMARFKGSDHRFFYLAALLTCFTLLVLALSRTGAVMFVGTLALEFLYLLSGKTKKEYIYKLYIRSFCALLLCSTMVLCFFYYNLISYDISVGESISNVSRLAESIAAINVFENNPIFGVGFGQFAFSAVQHLPNWAWISFEINGWYTDPEYFWPPLFNMYLRIASELGIIGLAIWCLYWTALLSLAFVQSCLIRVSSPKQFEVLRAISHTILAFLLSGISVDSFRSYVLWIAIGCLNIGRNSLSKEQMT